ncbi:MAG: hypothetical protein CMJ84_15815 [Planctomycetes bacterium]|jgi:hypothetical protein|nr:hypothetical protein [Planctomycetota bacterium]MDP6410457.1 hypothetical protein [Planctomycetota bacterium]
MNSHRFLCAAFIVAAASVSVGQNTTLWMDPNLGGMQWNLRAFNTDAIPYVSDEFDFYGPMYAELETNASGNVSAGYFHSSDSLVVPDIAGYFPNPIPSAPPLIDFTFEAVNFTLSSLPLNFGDPTNSDGSFQGELTLEVLSGTAYVDVLNMFPFEFDLTGLDGTTPVVFGQFTTGPGGEIHLDSPQSYYFVVTEPTTGITFEISLWGDLVADSVVTSQAYCFGDGTGSGCPCGNFGGSGEGCANGTGLGGLLAAGGSPSIAAAELVLEGSQLSPNQPGLYFQGDNAVNGGMGVTFGDGLRCAGGSVARLQVRVADGLGNSSTTIDIAAAGGVSAGITKRYQLWYRDPQASPCSTTFNLTNGMEIFWLP